MTLSFSVVIPTHRRPKTLGRLLESLQRQTYPRELFEVIVVPTKDDPGIAVARAFGVRVAEPERDPWQGRNPSFKRNHGVSAARGEWIAFTDDDCVAAPGWLAAFAEQTSGFEALEGAVRIPKPDDGRLTLTYKGLLLLGQRGGYQTCNMAYRRDVFLQVGGFDLEFPFYLEDTDLAWSVLDRGGTIGFAEAAVIEHPVPPPEPIRLLHAARRYVLLPYLKGKHPERYRAARMRPLGRGARVYLLLYALALGSAILGEQAYAAAALAAVVALAAAHTLKLFWGCRFERHELLVTAGLLPIVPVVAAFQLVRGLLRYRGAAMHRRP